MSAGDFSADIPGREDLSGLKVLWICFVWPEPDSSAAGYRTWQLLNTLKQAGALVSLSSGCQSNDYRQALEQQGFLTNEFAANDSRFDLFLQEFKPDLVFFDRFITEEQFSWRVRNACPKALRILDTIDLHFLRRNRQKNIKPEDFSFDQYVAHQELSDDCLRELASIYRSDSALLVSDFESTLLKQQFSVPADLLSVLPWYYSESVRSGQFEERKNIVWIGNFNHAPNLDSFQMLNDYLWEKICRIFSANNVAVPELHIYGAYLPDRFHKSRQLKNGIKIMGRAVNVFDCMQKYRVNLAALRFGAGLKGKVTDGWFAGTPCVGTPIAAEGLAAAEDFGGLVAADAENYAQAVYKLYTDKDLWQQSQAKGAKIISLQFCRKTTEQTFIALIGNLIKQGRGANNTLREILWHQQFRCTEYMSRWIELKNQVSAAQKPASGRRFAAQ